MIELMIVLIIAAVLLTIAAPSFQDSLQRNRRLSALENTLTLLSTARSEAVARATPVAMCPSADGANCSGENWEIGGLIFEDNGTGAGGVAEDGDRNGNEELIRVPAAFPQGITVRSGGSFLLAGRDKGAVLFNELGGVVGTGTLVICNADGAASASAVVINVSGQPRLAVDESADGIVNDDRGAANNVSCP